MSEFDFKESVTPSDQVHFEKSRVHRIINKLRDIALEFGMSKEKIDGGEFRRFLCTSINGNELSIPNEVCLRLDRIEKIEESGSGYLIYETGGYIFFAVGYPEKSDNYLKETKKDGV